MTFMVLSTEKQQILLVLMEEPLKKRVMKYLQGKQKKQDLQTMQNKYV